MRLNIHSNRRANAVQPGDVVDGGDAGPIVVDEVQIHLPTAPQPVVLLGRRPGATGGRRTALHFEHNDNVRVLPDADDAMAVWAEVVGAVELAIESWGNGHGRPLAGLPDDRATRPPWSVEAGELAVGVALVGTAFMVLVDPDPEPPPVDLEPEPTPDGRTERERLGLPEPEPTTPE